MSTTTRTSLLQRAAKAATSSSTAAAPSALTPYLNNADKVLDCLVDVRSVDRDDQLLHVATTFCPFLNEEERYGEAHSGCNGKASSSIEGPDDEKSDNDSDASFPINPVARQARSASFSSMSSFQGSGVSIKALMGGMSNELFIVQRNHHSVLVRIHPDAAAGSDGDASGAAVVDREIENKLVAWLSRQGVAPAYYGRFQNGRVEEFYQNVSPLSNRDMIDYTPQIAVQMAKFHAQKLPRDILSYPSHILGGRMAGIEKWFEGLLPQGAKAESAAESEGDTLVRDTSDLEIFATGLYREWVWLQQHLQSTPPASSMSPVEAEALAFIRQIVLTHMDCQSLNILVDMKVEEGRERRVRLIDFEYADWNPRAADIANTFCEFCDMNNLRANYAAEYPSEEDQNRYIICYIRETNPELAERLTNDSSALAVFRFEIGRFALLSHLGWIVWSVVMENQESSSDECDYLAYAQHRIDGYRYHKTIFGKEMK